MDLLQDISTVEHSPVLKRPDYSALRQQLPELDFSSGDEGPLLPALQDYRNYYNLQFPRANRTGVGTFTACGFELVAQYWLVEKPRGTLFICHGYFDHTGIYGAAVRFGLERDLNVVIFDFPGHGLSSGEPVAIDTFLQYRQVLDRLLHIARDKLPGPWHALGQSTGGAALLAYLQYSSWQPFDKVFLLAPLVRPARWHVRKWMYYLGRFFLMAPNRGFNINTHDAEFARRQAHRDPLQSPVMSMRWLGAMVDWLKTFPKTAKNPKPILVLQGTGDETVSWRYNMRAIRDRFPNSKRVIIRGARHQMINETQPYRHQILKALDDWLNA
ncbi:alpha/beta hydrolase [Microbulbifer marinus]|uniref:Lysophospholipase, alpha-beta hydrolase superfamily n=1 Tax=Microbulbifer marinus TaxID=658218 RepID=A0A1H3YKX4_9GAMM|nr:alpha/beta hydrolase [Microbulbifer marinus]SEA12196.1 Lysophospholipase, alpha-beta hydrolase superfamily [Microbulbifer marinus]